MLPWTSRRKSSPVVGEVILGRNVQGNMLHEMCIHTPSAIVSFVCKECVWHVHSCACAFMRTRTHVHSCAHALFTCHPASPTPIYGGSWIARPSGLQRHSLHPNIPLLVAVCLGVSPPLDICKWCGISFVGSYMKIKQKRGHWKPAIQLSCDI